MNMGDYVGARENFEALSKKSPKLDFVWYGMAVLNCLTGHFPEALTSLSEAIRLNPANRFQARNDATSKAWPTIRVSPSCFILISAPRLRLMPESGTFSWRSRLILCRAIPHPLNCAP